MLREGFEAFNAAPVPEWRPTMRVFPGNGVERESTVSRVQPDLQRKAYVRNPGERVEPFSGADWGVGGSLALGKKVLEPPAALDYHRAQRKHLTPPGGVGGSARGEWTIEDHLHRKGHVLLSGVDQAHARSSTFGLETEWGRKRRVTPRLELRDGELIPAGSQAREHVVYTHGYFALEGVTPSVRMGIQRYAPSRQGEGDKLRERPKTLSFSQRNAADIHQAEEKLVEGLELSYDEDACSPRPVMVPPPAGPAESRHASTSKQADVPRRSSVQAK